MQHRVKLIVLPPYINKLSTIDCSLLVYDKVWSKYITTYDSTWCIEEIIIPRSPTRPSRGYADLTSTDSSRIVRTTFSCTKKEEGTIVQSYTNTGCTGQAWNINTVRPIIPLDIVHIVSEDQPVIAWDILSNYWID